MIMNKRFSTLLATALVAGGLSFNAAATEMAADKLEDGQFIHLIAGASTATDYLTMDAKGVFAKVEASSWDGKTTSYLVLFGRLS